MAPSQESGENGPSAGEVLVAPIPVAPRGQGRSDCTTCEPLVHHLYKGVNVPWPFCQTITAIEELQCTPDDVCIMTNPKSGSNFSAAVVNMILGDANPDAMTEGSFLEFKLRDSIGGRRDIDTIKTATGPRVFYTHFKYDALPESITKHAKIVHVARNPKDCLTSFHYFLDAWRPAGQRVVVNTLEQLALTFFDETQPYGPFFEHTARGWAASKTNSNMYFTTFERLTKDPKNTIRALSKFLGKDFTEEQIDAVAHHTSFEIMKNNDNINKLSFMKKNWMIRPFCREGKAGDWKNHFSPELNSRTNVWIEQEKERYKDELEGFEFEYE